MIIVNKNINKYKNRGLELERILINTFNQKKYSNIALIEKSPTPIQVLKNDEDFISKAYFKRVSSLDFCGVFKGKHIEIEAKSTQNTTIFNFNNIQDHQYERMKKLIELDSLVYLVIEFKTINKFFIMEGKQAVKFYEGKPKNISIDIINDCSIELFLKPNFTLDILENI
jgi:recombination protein U